MGWDSMIISSLHIYFLSMNKIFLDFSLNSLVIYVLINCLWWQMELWLWNNNFREIQFCRLQVRWQKSQQTLKWKAIKEAKSYEFATSSSMAKISTNPQMKGNQRGKKLWVCGKVSLILFDILIPYINKI